MKRIKTYTTAHHLFQSQHVIETRNAEVYDGEVEPSLQIRQRRKAKKQKERGHETGRSSHQQRGLNNGEDEDETDNGRMGRRIHAREKTPRSAYLNYCDGNYCVLSHNISSCIV